MHISDNGLRLIESFEGLRLQRYLDSVGVPTIGYGTTAAVINPVPETCTLAQAQQWLQLEIERSDEPAINALDVPLNQNQFDALCSLCYNCGPGAMQWQIGRDLKARNYSAAANDFLHYVYAGGQVLQGLVNRRQAERALFLTPVTPPPPPPPPPDPMHYAWFDDTIRSLGTGRSGSEQAIVREYDQERAWWKKFPNRLTKLRQDMTYLADRLQRLLAEDPGSAESDHRQWRHDQLAGRAAGKRYC